MAKIKQPKHPIEPVGWQLLVRLEKAEIKSDGGIFLPDAIAAKSQFAKTRGVVVGMGELCYSHKDHKGKPWCKVGDTVFIPKDQGMFIPEGEGDDMIMYKLANDNDVKGLYVKN